ncbi:DUF202 domain-containing protein [Sphingopyxis sp.]|uniref:YidH family protein n=1 Tax=Sphingopyxis sp. TaxID=1908224 RepID=UPI001E1ABBF2|nr:DUF202 domain-containing protein [Sphingopyxis sp.]MBW8294465.1 DUF202 domain-containing protein [Sphingopyxis sp.]
MMVRKAAVTGHHLDVFSDQYRSIQAPRRDFSVIGKKTGRDTAFLENTERSPASAFACLHQTSCLNDPKRFATAHVTKTSPRLGVWGVTAVGDFKPEHVAEEPAPMLPVHQKITEHLAAERTFLAWIRTSVAIISLGFVVAKFGLWLHELASRFDPDLKTSGTGASLPIGVSMMVFGSLIAILAACHFFLIERAIERGDFKSNRQMVIGTSAGIVLLSVAIIGYLVLTTVYL